ncbi:hypothetical protein E2C01_100109 [Portunus trituberculatus]|uniref:Uncharacterized protein n=1 Tax=Portunus trituberculatus TaxID=210409 RepID=A0A5B7K766_PORTR|nr:hypothetical protein [Portunus trituberculatus]
MHPQPPLRDLTRALKLMVRLRQKSPALLLRCLEVVHSLPEVAAAKKPRDIKGCKEAAEGERLGEAG